MLTVVLNQQRPLPYLKKTKASVRDAISDTPEKAENMKLRSALMIALKSHITDKRSESNRRRKTPLRHTPARVQSHARQDQPIRTRFAGKHGDGSRASR
jgi:predicted XRE-type DNA-binding protein